MLSALDSNSSVSDEIREEVFNNENCLLEDRLETEKNVFNSNYFQSGDKYSIYYSNLDTFLNKKSEILDLINKENPDIIAFSEILNKKNPTITKAELNIEGYDAFYREEESNNKLLKRRGVIIYTKKSMNANFFTGFDNYAFREHIWCSFNTINNENILIGVAYHSGSSTEENTKALFNLLKSEIFNQFDRVFLCGDFNFPNASWDGKMSTDKDEEFYEAVRDGFFIQHVTRPTRFRENQQSNILDLIFTRDDEDINNIEYCSPIGKSDHVLLKICTTVPKIKVKQKDSIRYDWDNGDYTSFKNYIATTDWEILKTMDVNKCWLFIKEKIQEGIEKFIPTKTLPNNIKDKPPWMSITVKKSVKRKHKLFKRFLQSDSSKDYKEYINQRNITCKLIKQAKKCHEKNIASHAKTNPKQFWKYVNSKRKCREKVAALQKEDGSLTTNNKEKANLLIDFFSSVMTHEDLSNLDKIHITPGEKSDNQFISDVTITAQEVKNKLKDLNPNKSPGPDKIYPKVLKELHEELSGPLSHLFNKSFSNNILPDDWKLAEISAIFKKGNRSNSNNYRPVSLTCILCKVMESFIRDKIQNHMEDLNLYCKCQHGFRQGRSCITQLLEVMDNFSNFIDNGQDFDVIYLDFKKAFDSVPHERLLIKLKSYGITGNLYYWVKDFLSGRTQYVKVENELSETRKVISGIPQGSILGPVLFLIFINDLPECIKSISDIFADDTKAFNTCKNSDIIQEDLKSLQDWSDKWQLFFNCTKCKCLHFGKNNPKREYHFPTKEGNKTIPTSTEEKDLGVIFDTTLKFDLHIESIIKKANSMIGLIKRNFSFIDIFIFLKLYKALIRPHLEYGQIIWSPQYKRQSKIIENVQRRATKLIPNLKNLPYQDRLKKLKLPTLKFRRLRGDLINVYKILTNEKSGSKHLLPLNNSKYNTRGHDRKLEKNRFNCKLRQCSFSIRVTNIWNSLSNKVTNANSIDNFKKLLDEELHHLKYVFD